MENCLLNVNHRAESIIFSRTILRDKEYIIKKIRHVVANMKHIRRWRSQNKQGDRLSVVARRVIFHASIYCLVFETQVLSSLLEKSSTQDVSTKSLS